LLTVVGNVAPAADGNGANGCIGYEEMRIFASDPTVRGVIEYNEKFSDLGTKSFNGTSCPGGVIGLAKTVIARSIAEPLKIRAKKAALEVAVQFWTVLPRGAASPALSN